MKAIVAINPKMKSKIDYQHLGTIMFGTLEIIFGVVEFEQPNFAKSASKNDDYLFLKVTAFSCNFRDKGILTENYKNIEKTERLFVPFGSEFCAEVIEVGNNVKEFQIGDRVMPNSAYPDSGSENLLPGVATNLASLGWLRIHKNKLIKVPDGMTDIEAASFTLGAQTASGMIRRSGLLEQGGVPMVFSARSATSLFIIQQLNFYGYSPICLTSSDWSKNEKEKISPALVKKIDISKKEISNEILEKKVTHIFDPFFDMNLYTAVQYLQMDGIYITCGLRDQHPLLSKIPDDSEMFLRSALSTSIVKNLSILGNCLGGREDLEKAIQMQLPPIIDSHYKVNQGLRFIEHSFFEANKLGKCVLRYY